MSVEWTAYPFKRALRSAVAARAGITGLTNPTVQTFTYLPGPWEPLVDAIVFGFNIEDTKELITVGGQTHDEFVDIRSQVRTVRPGGGQTQAEAAEDRARAILAEIDDELRTNNITVAGAQIINPHIAQRESGLFSIRMGEVAAKTCVVEFVVRYRAKTSA